MKGKASRGCDERVSAWIVTHTDYLEYCMRVSINVLTAYRTMTIFDSHIQQASATKNRKKSKIIWVEGFSVLRSCMKDGKGKYTKAKNVYLLNY